MLEKERFLAIKKLARDIREDNKSLFKKLDKKSTEDAVEEKNKFIEKIIDNMSIAFSDGEQGKEEKQIFRANILIPDDDDFYKTYSENKNIRSLMKKYAVNIEDIMGKITELNIYNKYIEDFNDSSVEDLPKISSKEAEELLDEIDSLSNNLPDIDINSEEPKVPSFIKAKPKFVTETHESVDTDGLLDESFDNISRTISDFVNDYNSIKESTKEKDEEIKSLKENVKELKSENNILKGENSKLIDEVKKLDSENNSLKYSQDDYKVISDKLKEENADLIEENERINKRMKLLEEKLIKSTTLLNKIYKGIKN